MPTLPALGPGDIIDIAVLASGSGTNLQVLLDTPAIRPRICVVISDVPGARALQRAEEAGVSTALIRFDDHPHRADFSAAVAEVIEEAGGKGVVLAGFMRVLSAGFIERFPGRILNIHPSLLPAFPGSKAVEAALAHGVKVTGVTVHFVDEKVDNGPIVAQRAVMVDPADTVESLHGRIQVEEHDLYPSVVAAFVEGRLNVEGRKVVWS